MLRVVPAAVSHPRALLSASVALYAAVFTAFLFFELPGLGIAHFFYVAIAMAALATGPAVGAAAGMIATALYVLGVLLNPHIPPTEVLTASTGIRLVTFTAIGGLVGWFAARNRALVERLRILAERDLLTGLPNSRAFEAAFARRLGAARPFAVLLADMHALGDADEVRGGESSDDVLRRVADLLSRKLSPEDEIARVGGAEFAVLTTTAEYPNVLCSRLESTLSMHGMQMSFGWALYPDDGSDALSLIRAADERLYLRKFVKTPPDTVQTAAAVG
jgi:diguanylate cyclase (GGDEF)-like protein